MLTALLLEILERPCGLSPEMVDRDAPLTVLGLDSLMLMSFRRQLRARSGLEISVSLLFTQTIRDLTTHIDEALREDPRTIALLEELESLTDAEAADLLAEEGAS